MAYKQRICSRNLIFLTLTLTLLVGSFLFVIQSLFAQTLPIGNQQQIGQVGELGSANDFNNDVRLGVQNLAVNPTAQVQQTEIGSQDYKSMWDEFGTNSLIDGTTPPSEVGRKITEDAIQAVQTEANYNQQESKYLEDTRITPEEIQVTEESRGSDVSPGEFIDPNPSIGANPDVSVSVTEDQGQNNVEASTSPEESTPALQATSTPETSTSTPEMTTSSVEASTSPEESTPALQATSTPETSTSTPEMTTSSDELIFNAILQGEQTLINPSPESAQPPTEPPPLEPPPAE